VRRIYDLLKEPTGRQFDDLVRASMSFCGSFLLVVRDGPLKPSGRRVLDQLQPYVREKAEKAEWPGTRLTTSVATVWTFDLVEQSAAILTATTNRLYAWLQPDLPEDPCFIREDGTPWLTTISHERDAFLSLETIERDLLRELVPELHLDLAPLN
jgi:hypothetical protein